MSAVLCDVTAVFRAFCVTSLLRLGERVEPEGDTESLETGHLAVLRLRVSVEDQQPVSVSGRQVALEAAGRV